MSRYGAPPSSDAGISAYQRSDTSRRHYGSNPLVPPGTGGSSTLAPPTMSSDGRRAQPQEDPEQSRKTARAHYNQLNSWLYQGRGRSSERLQNRAAAREKLTRLTRQQFSELSTDVYDELCRRIERGEHDGGAGKGGVPFLLSRDEFHPKRNQARQKLATLPQNRFRDLASDVFFEIERRYPEFVEPEVPPPASGDPPPALAPSSSISRDQGSGRDESWSAAPTASSRLAGGVASEVVVPDKSTLVVEDNAGSAPSSRNEPTDGPVPPPSKERAMSPESAADRSDYYDKMSLGGRASEGSAVGSRLLNSIGNSGTVAGSATESAAKDRERDEVVEKMRSDYEYKLAQMQTRLSTAETDLKHTRKQAEASVDAGVGRVRDLEGQIAEMENELHATRAKHEQALQEVQRLDGDKIREVEAAKEESSRLRRAVRELERAAQTSRSGSISSLAGNVQVDKLRAEVRDLLAELRNMQGRQDDLLAEREKEAENVRELQGEAAAWRRRYEAAKTELRRFQRTSSMFVTPRATTDNSGLSVSDDGVVADIHSTSFTTTIDDLLLACRSNKPSEVISATRTVVGAVSRIDEDISAFEAAPRPRRQLSEEDRERLTTLQARANATLGNLITASKNHATGSGLSPVSLVDAAASHLTATIIDLIKLMGLRKATTYEVEEASSMAGDEDLPLPPLSTSNSLSTDGGGGAGNRNGLSQAAARRSDEGDPVGGLGPSYGLSSSRGPPAPLKGLGMSGTTTSFDEDRYGAPLRSPLPRAFEDRDRNREYRGAVKPLYDDLRSPTGGRASSASESRELGDSLSGSSGAEKVFDSPPRRTADQARNYGLGPTRSEEEERERLRAYLEAQTESIVANIQSLLSSIRGPQSGPPVAGPPLSETLTQIITIVSSIVAIAGDRMPPHPDIEGILQDLTANCDRLSEMQDVASSSGFGKQTKQAMAAASFGVAKALKQLNSYIASTDSSSLL